MIRISELNEYAKGYVKEHFDLELRVSITINPRLTRTLGRYASRGSQPVSLELSKQLLDNHSKAEVYDVLNHELVHYSLHMLGLPYDDRDRTFIDACNRLGVSLTGTIKTQTLRLYQCDCMVHKSYKRVMVSRARCVHCNSRLHFIGTEKKEG